MVSHPVGGTTVNNNPSRLSRLAAFVAGAGLLIMTVLAGYANFAILEKLVDQHNPALTAQHIRSALPLFQQGYQAFYAVAGLDALVAWALFGLFRPAAPYMSLLSAVLRSIYAGGLACATYQLQLAYELYAGTSGSGNAFAYIQTFYAVWEMALILFGFHLLVVGWLVFIDKRLSGTAATILGSLLIIAGLGYIVDGIAFLFYPATTFAVTSYTFVGEVVFMAWLLWTCVSGGRKAR